MGKSRKNMKNTYFELVYPSGKYVLKVCFESLNTRMISTLKYIIVHMVVL